jgi:hypothetical protein
VQVKKNVFLKFFQHHRAKKASGDIANQVLSACSAKSNSEGRIAEQTLRFRAAVLLGGVAAAAATTSPVCNNTLFKSGKYSICTLNLEKKAKCRCCHGKIGNVTPRQ